MKEELQTKLVEILSAIQTTTGQAKDFTLAQLPDVAQSYVAYGRAMNTSVIVLCLLVVLACGWFAHHTKKQVNLARAEFKKGNKGDYEYLFEIHGFPQYMVCGFASALAALVSTTNLGPFLMVWMAPKVWLLQQIASMVK